MLRLMKRLTLRKTRRVSEPLVLKQSRLKDVGCTEKRPHFLPGEAQHKTESIAVIRFNVIEVICGFDKNKAILGTVLLIPKAVLCPFIFETGGVTPQVFLP